MYKINLQSNTSIKCSDPAVCHGCLSILCAFLLSGRGLYDGTINGQEDFYRVCECVFVSVCECVCDFVCLCV